MSSVRGVTRPQALGGRWAVPSGAPQTAGAPWTALKPRPRPAGPRPCLGVWEAPPLLRESSASEAVPRLLTAVTQGGVQRKP